jgi:alginate O-acetyltransferase complex protein AlgI
VIFNSVTYLVFLSLIVCLFWALPKRPRLWMIFLSSLVFYGFWRPEFVILMICSAGADFVAARRINALEAPSARRFWLAFSLSVNLGLLLYFKYLLFFVDNAVVVLRFFGEEVQAPALSIVLPLGISFYTFQTISYVVDVYRKSIPAEKDFLLYGCFVTFFPQLVAGPILRGSELLGQLAKKPVFHLDTFASGLRRIILGLFLKVVLADNIAPFVDEGFAGPIAMMSAIDVLTLAFLFGFQIYFDFSAYSHIALGSARLMGIHFPENFDFPYISRSPKEFWQRWHISLSSWVRDYIYLPLIGAKAGDHSVGGLGSAGSKRNSHSRHPMLILFLTWGVMGFWHGANWTFIFWGLYHATFIFAYRASERYRSQLPDIVRNVFGWCVTLPVIMLSWIPFRAKSIEDSLSMFAILLRPRDYLWLGMRENSYLAAATLMTGFLLVRFIHHKYAHLYKEFNHFVFWIDTAVIGVVAGLVFVFLRPLTQFIYFQF